MAWQAAIGAQLAVDGRRGAAGSEGGGLGGRRTRRAASVGRRAAKLGGVLVGREMCGVVAVVRGGGEAVIVKKFITMGVER